MVPPLRYILSESPSPPRSPSEDSETRSLPILQRAAPRSTFTSQRSLHFDEEDEIDSEDNGYEEDFGEDSYSERSQDDANRQEWVLIEGDIEGELERFQDTDDEIAEDAAILQHIDSPEIMEANEAPTLTHISQEGKSAEFRRWLQKLETAEALALYYPPQFSDTYAPKLPLSDEATALDELNATHFQSDGENDHDHFLELELHDFCVYRSPEHPKGFQGQYEYLHVAAINPEVGHWLVDGILKSNGKQRRITGYIQNISVGNYEDITQHTTSGAIWITTEVSSQAGTQDIWYQLKEPAGGYRIYWYEFLWLADFAKHFIDFLDYSTKTGRKLTLLDLKSNFWTQLQEWHGDIQAHGTTLHCWREQRQKDLNLPIDFRRDALWYCQWLRHQVYSLCQGDKSEEEAHFDHPVWDEINAGHWRSDVKPESKNENTVVTKNVAACFHEHFPHWQNKHKLLDIVDICPEVELFREKRRKLWSFPNKFDVDQKHHFVTQDRKKISKVDYLLEEASTANQPVRLRNVDDLLGKIIVVRMLDGPKDRTVFYYAWVREVLSRAAVAVVWLFRPGETLCDTGFYPIGNELFFSNECNCDPVPIADIVKMISASVFTDRALRGADLFVHSMFNDELWVHTIPNRENVVCHCKDRIYTKPKKNPDAVRRGGLPKLRTLGLFSGMGLLEHAMASTGYIQPVCAVEHWETAATTYKANDELSRTRVLTGSVNPCLFALMTGRHPIEPVDCITAGCPCQGYSLLNPNKQSRRSQQNCSLLANALSWFEVLLPAYGVIENVPNMDSLNPNPCAQAICHFVALGYQVRKRVIDVSTLGGASSRKRLIITVAAPGAVFHEDFKETHGENGEQRLRTCEEATSNLRPLANDTVVNISDPDHVPLHRFKVDFMKNVNFRDIVERIPTRPAGLGVVAARKLGRLTISQREWLRTLSEYQQGNNSKCLRRINRTKPFKTVCCAINPIDGWHSGEILHYEQHRTISIKEARRAMDLPDYILLAGNLREQYKQLGNGVPWTLGAALGRLIGKAWVATLAIHPELGDSSTAPRFTPPTALSTTTLEAAPTLTPNLTPTPTISHTSPPTPAPANPISMVVNQISIEKEKDNRIVVLIDTKRPRRAVDSEEDSDIEFLYEKPSAKKQRE